MMEQIIIRVGTDAKGVATGLNQITALVKGWGTSMAHHLKGAIGGFFAFAAIERGFETIKSKILEINRIRNNLGVSGNLAQGIMAQAEKEGESFEAIEKPLKKFSQLIGEAKMGGIEARKKLFDLGIAFDSADFAAGNLTQKGLSQLADQFQKLGTLEEKNALAMSAFGREYAAILPLLEKGSAGINALDSGNFFTKINQSSLTNLGELWANIKTGTIGIGATLANVVGGAVTGFAKIYQALGIASTGQNPFKAENWANMDKAEKDQAAADSESLDSEMKKRDVIAQQAELKEKMAELESQEADRNKPTLEALAERARKLLGLQHVPRGLNSIYSVTPAMREALRITGLQDRAQIAYARGQGMLGGVITQNELAARGRLDGGVFTRQDRQPLAKVESELSTLNAHATNIDVISQLLQGKTPGSQIKSHGGGGSW